MPSGHSGSIFGEKPSQRVGRAYRGAVSLHRLARGEEAGADYGGMVEVGGYTATALTAAHTHQRLTACQAWASAGLFADYSFLEQS